MTCLREELEESKAANAELHALHLSKQQAWQEDRLRTQAVHDQQVSLAVHSIMGVCNVQHQAVPIRTLPD